MNKIQKKEIPMKKLAYTFLIIGGCFVLLLFSGNVMGTPAKWTNTGPKWIQVNPDGFGDSNNTTASLVIFENALYAGTSNSETGAEVWRYDGEGWTRVDGGTPPGNGGFGDSYNEAIGLGAVFNDRLYVGVTNRRNGGAVWSYDGATWIKESADGFGNVRNGQIVAPVIFDGDLYVGTRNALEGGEVWRYDGATWSQLVTAGFGDENNDIVFPGLAFQNKLYAGTLNETTGGEVWSYDGTTWVQENEDGFGDAGNVAAAPGVIFQGELYLGTFNYATGGGGALWGYDGTTWAKESEDGLGDPANVAVFPGTVFQNPLYVGTFNETTGAEVWSYDGTRWMQVNRDGFGDVTNQSVGSFVVFQDELYASVGPGRTPVGTGAKVWKLVGWQAYLPVIMKNYPTPIPTPTPTNTPTPTPTNTPTPTPTPCPLDNVSGLYTMTISEPFDTCPFDPIQAGTDIIEIVQDGNTIIFITAQGTISGTMDEDLHFELSGITYEGNCSPAGCVFNLGGDFALGDPMTFAGSGNMYFYGPQCSAFFNVGGTRTSCSS
jgi:hypothetical protein